MEIDVTDYVQEEWEQACHDGQTSGRLSQGDDDRWYFYVGS